MKILAVSHLFPNREYPNNNVFVKERIRYIAKKLDVTMVAPIQYFPMNHLIHKYKNFHKIPKEDHVDHLKVFHPRFFTTPKFFKFLDGYFYYLSMNRFMRQFLKDNTIQLLDFHWVFPDAFAGIRWAEQFRKKIIVTIRGNEPICYFENSLRKRMILQFLKKADHLISVSNDLKKKVVQEYGVSESKVTVIPNGIDHQKFFMMDKSKARMLCGLEQGKKYILSLSRLSHEKGLEYLLKAFSMIKNVDDGLIIAGDGPLKTHLLKTVDDLNLTGSVRFIGSVPHKNTYLWYNSADIYCLPSLWEGCPNTIIESLSCGTPVVATNVGGIPDLVPSDIYGLLVPPGDALALSTTLRNALNRDWDRFAIAAFGSQNTWEHVADQVIDVYQKVLN